MKWVYSIKYKLQTALALSLIVLIVFLTNVMDKRNITALGIDFVSFYDDRLVVESYIFEITEHLFLMKLSINNSGFDESSPEKGWDFHYTSILEIIKNFEKTKLTKDEAMHLAQLKQKIENYFKSPSPIILDSAAENDYFAIFNKNFEAAFNDVKALSAIQLYEGKKLTKEVDRLVSRSGLWTQVEMAVLVILMIIIYLLIFSSQSIRSKIKQNPSLN